MFDFLLFRRYKRDNLFVYKAYLIGLGVSCYDNVWHATHSQRSNLSSTASVDRGHSLILVISARSLHYSLYRALPCVPRVSSIIR